MEVDTGASFAYDKNIRDRIRTRRKIKDAFKDTSNWWLLDDEARHALDSLAGDLSYLLTSDEGRSIHSDDLATYARNFLDSIKLT
jgi:hypothetical protein